MPLNFIKEQMTNRIKVLGEYVPWVQLSGNAGYITLPDDSPVAAELSKLVGRLGITKISDEELVQKKTSRKFVPSKLNRFGKASVQPIKPIVPKPRVEAEAAAPVIEDKPSVVSPAPVSTAPKIGKLKPVTLP